MKNAQKINESQLRAIVAESIKKALNEIDWKTYHNAGDKALRMKDIERARSFYKAAANRFKEDYGDDNTQIWDDDCNGGFLYGEYFPNDSDVYDVREKFIDRNGKTRYGGDGAIDWPYSSWYNAPENYLKTRHPEGTSVFDKMDDEHKKHVGNTNIWNRDSQYDYNNEKGWHLKNKK